MPCSGKQRGAGSQVLSPGGRLMIVAGIWVWLRRCGRMQGATATALADLYRSLHRSVNFSQPWFNAMGHAT